MSNFSLKHFSSVFVSLLNVAYNVVTADASFIGIESHFCFILQVHRPVDEENCFTVARKPDPVRFCHIPRPQDCVLGPFGEWSTCKGCPAANQTRVRAVLVAPLNGGKPCPELTETRVCNPRTECLMHSSSSAEDGSRAPSPEYKLKLGEWRRCEAPTSVVSADLIEARNSAGKCNISFQNLQVQKVFGG